MDVKIYAINLDRSRERWDSITRQATELDLDVVRVPGLDGSLVQAGDRIDCDDPAFRRKNGRTMLPGEYGCYRSHLQALRTFVDSGEPIGIIAEDDVELTRDLPARVAAAFGRSFQPCHFAMSARRDPLAECFRVAGFGRPGDPAIVESQFRRPRLDLCDHARWVKK